MNYKTVLKEEKWTLVGIIVLFILATIMHFLYELSGNIIIVGFFAPVNESIWEHLKLILVPMILWWSIYYLVRKNEIKSADKWFTALLGALISSLVSIPLLYYFYTEAFGIEKVWIDILITLISVAIGQLIGLHFYRYSKGLNKYIALFIIFIIVIIFVVFTVYPAILPIFKDGPTGTYGILKKTY